MACCYSGDDSLFFGKLSETPGWSRIEHNFTLIGKTAITPIPEFCGWLLYPCGVIRHPILLALKIVYRAARGDLPKVLDSYFLESQFAHEHSDRLYDYLPPLALEAQSWITDFCFEHSSLVPHLRYAVDPQAWKDIPIALLPAHIAKQLNINLGLANY